MALLFVSSGPGYLPSDASSDNSSASFMESPQDESKALARSFTDKSRAVKRRGRQFIVPHKFTESGEVVNDNNFDARKHISKLNLDDLRFLQAWRDNSWNDEKTSQKLGLQPDQAEKTFKKLAYFKTEDARIKALASEATPERVLAKDMENIETGGLNDSQHKSLDRVAKITGAFKTVEGGSTINIFNMPRMSPEVEAQMRIIADKEADIIDAEVA